MSLALCSRCQASIGPRLVDLQSDIDRLPTDTRPGRDDVWHEAVGLEAVQDIVTSLLVEVWEPKTVREPAFVFTTEDIQVIVAVQADGRARLSLRRSPHDTWSPPYYSTLGG